MEESKRSRSNRDGDDRKEEYSRRDREKDKLREKENHRDRDSDRCKYRDRESRHIEKAREDRDSLKEERRDRKEREDRGSEKEKVKERKEREDRDLEKEERRVRKEREDRDLDKEERRERKEREERDLEKEERRERKEREKEKEREREKAKEREDKEREKAKEREREDREREKAREREREREREEKEREKVKERERERAREKERIREKENTLEKEREKERERRRREREREEREREKEREREREKERAREKRREERDNDRDVEHDRKRRRRDESSERDRDRDRERDRNGRHRDGGDDRRKSNEESEEKEKKTREENMEEEQRKLDEEMDKRRRRVQEWQELKRKKEEIENKGDANDEEISTVGKKWTLEGESDDEEGKEMDVDEDAKPNGDISDKMDVDGEESKDLANGDVEAKGDDDEIDPLDAFMSTMVLPEVEKLSSVEVAASNDVEEKPELENKVKGKESIGNGVKPRKDGKNVMGRIIQGEDSDSDYEEEAEDDEAALEDEDDDEFLKRVKKTKAEKLSIVDHSKIQYPPFRKNFYIEVKEISKMTSDEVAAYRKELELKIHGKDVPKPIKTWYQTGLTGKVLDIIKKLNFEKPMSIQAQALPIIMSGRDCIGIAKTGSGKTLAFVLPMLRHIKDQPPVMPGDGPIALIMAPTRELVQQIHSDIKKFSKVMGINCVPVYGGSGVAQQISDLKRGTEIVVCTPGRMIDILCTSAGKITNLRRVTYFVMDEADRMFDMGFEPQITRIVQNTRPDRQTVLFSATFPRQVEVLARKVLNKPVEIQVGGRSVVNRDITQLVEVRPESERFLRLLELLGEWYEKGKILVFVHSQDKCDALFKELLKVGYACVSLHGGKDQTDRESTIADFKSNVSNILIATSVAARGLDVKELELVVNFDVPNHYEDYVHRVGRTGRAGKKGCAVTFISEDDARYAPDLVKALELSEQAIPADLKALADAFMTKVNQGTEQAHGTGYGGSGFKFNEEEEEARKAVKKAQAREYGFEEYKSESEDEDEGIRKAGGELASSAAIAQAAAIAAATRVATSASLPTVSLPGVINIPNAPSLPVTTLANDAAVANALQAAMNLQQKLGKIQADAMPEHYQAELEINDFPQNARWRVTHKETLGPISEWTGASITTRGTHVPPGKILGPGERKLYLFIEGPTEASVRKAKAEVKRVLEDITAQALSLPGGTHPGKYSVI